MSNPNYLICKVYDITFILNMLIDLCHSELSLMAVFLNSGMSTLPRLFELHRWCND